MENYKLYINGNFQDSSSKKTFTSIDPSTEGPWASFAEANADDVKKKLEKQFVNETFKNAFVFEAATGDQKFGNAEQRADYMLCWAPKGKIEQFVVKAYTVGTASAPSDIIKKYAKAIDLQVNWKSSSNQSHLNYNMYQNYFRSLYHL